MATKPLLCRVGRHHWVHVKNLDGDPYDRCQRCGTDRFEPSISRRQAAAGAELRSVRTQLRGQSRQHRTDGPDDQRLV